MRGIFVTGTDRGVGQTTVAGALSASLVHQGRRVAVCKPVQTGCPLADPPGSTAVDGLPGEVDAPARAALARLAQLAGSPPAVYSGRTPPAALAATDARYLMQLSGCDAPLDRVNPYRFAAAVEPAAAARVAETAIDIDHILRSMHRLADEADLLVVDGEGGVLTPLTEERRMIDLIAASGLAALVVAPSRPGAVNHCLLTLEALGRRDLPICGIVLDRLSERPSPEEAANPLLIERFAGELVRGILPYFTAAQRGDPDHLAARFRVHVDLEAILASAGL